MRITRGRDITPEILNEILAAAGVLGAGAVAQATNEMESDQKGFIANVARFRLAYSGDVPDRAPRSLFLKVTKLGLHPEYRHAGGREIEFYTRALPPAHELPVARCYYAEWDAEAGRAALLLEDLSASHFQRPLPLPPAPRHCELAIESLARVHAHWWNDPRLGRAIGAALTQAEADATIGRLVASYPHFGDFMGEALLPAQRSAYERILGSSFLQRRAQRLQALQAVTLIHGDAHTNNIMLPYDTASGRAILIDWQRWGIDIPPYDLAFFMALHWSAERRAALERALVRRYYETLAACGVDEYTWRDCWDDYRAAVIVMALIPIGQLRRGMPTGVVWYGMEQSVAAFNDLGCWELL